jgi:periplasmic protein TonB
MNEAVSDILIERARVTEGMSRMVAVSLTAHVALLTTLVLLPGLWRSSTGPEPVLMTISIGGTEGPELSGMTSISDRAVQAVAPPDAKPEPDTPPARTAPEMTEPDRVVKPTIKAKPVEKPADKSSSRKPTTGAEIKTGDARVKTGGAAIPFGGLAQGGGGTGGVQLDVQNFCCPEYIQTMVQRIRQSWNQNQGATGEVWVKFTIRRDGMLTLVEVEKPSGQAMLDLESRRAVLMTRQLPPLPAQFTEPHLTVHLAFNYKR